MRMGQSENSNKGKRSRQKKPILQKASDSTQVLKNVGGPLSSNLIESIYQSKITNIANQQAEDYAEALLKQDLEAEEKEGDVLASNENEDEDETKGEEKGKQTNQTEPFSNYLFASTDAREELLTILSETSSHFSTIAKSKSVPKWKVHANAAKFERLLDEKYGRLRPIINQYPQIETHMRIMQRKYNRGEYSPFRQGPAPIDKKGSIILIVIMHRNGVRPETVFLTALFFLIGLQPWALVLLVSLGHFLFERRKKKRIAGWLGDHTVKPVKSYYAAATESVSEEDEVQVTKAKHEILLKPVGEPITSMDFKDVEEEGSETYDTVIVGSGPSTLYTAALLSRTGRTVLVLSPEMDASGCRTMDSSNRSGNLGKYANVPFDIEASNVAHTSVQQKILVPALCSETDAQGGIRFAQIGSEADGFTTDMLSIPGMGVDSYKESVPFLIRGGGVPSIAIDAATYLGDAWPNEDGVGDSTSAAYLNLCASINASAKDYYVTKLLPKKVSDMQKATTYQEASIRFASGFLDKGLPLNPHVRSLMAGIGMRGENIPPSKTSMAAQVTNICACLSSEGFSYPVGGPRALCHALASVVEQNGGRIVTGVNVKEFVFGEVEEQEQTPEGEEKVAEEKEAEKPRCHGVKLDDDRIISVGMDEDSCVMSMLGFIQTFIFKMPSEIRLKGLPVGLPALSERRPLLKFMFCLDGNKDELSLTGADWYRLPNAGLPLDERDPETGEVTPGHIGISEDEDVNVNVNEDGKAEGIVEIGETEGSADRGKRLKTNKKSRRVEFDQGYSWMKIAFPSAKDPSWKERHDDVSTCVVTIEAGSDFVRMFDTLPKVYSSIKCGPSVMDRLVEKVTKDLIVNFPQLEEKILFCEMAGPIRGGLSHNPQRFAAKGIRPETPYPGLFVGGSDLTVGDSFSASIVGSWIASNAVMGYSFVDHLFLEKNITSDITRFLNSPKIKGEENIAVPFQSTYDATEINTAESSKEE